MVDQISAEPLWTQTASAAPDIAPLSEDLRCDVAVVGAGVLGLSVALHAAERGARVTLLEAGPIGAGASGVNAGRVMPGFVRNSLDDVAGALGARRAEALAVEIAGSGDLVFELIERLGIECDARRSGWIVGAHARLRVRDLRRRREEWRSLGRDLPWLEAEEARALTGCGFHAGLLDPSAGHLNPLSFVRGLTRAAQAAGVAVHTGTPVRSVARTAQGWRLAGDRGAVTADQAFLCLNGRPGPLAPTVHRSLLSLHIYEMATAPLGEELARSILPHGHMVSDTRNAVFGYHLDPESRLLTGTVTPPRLRARRRAEWEGRRHLSMRLGLPRDLPIRHLWHGRGARAPDSRPHIYRIAPGLWAPMACNGRGIASCTVVGRLCAALADGEDVPLRPEPPHPLPFHAVTSVLHGLLISASAVQDHLTP